MCNWKPVSFVAHLVYTQQALQADFALSGHTAKPAATSALATHQRGCANHPGAAKSAQVTEQPARVKGMAAPDRISGYWT